MRIGIFDPYLDTMTGGERYILGIASCLSNNHDVSLFWNDTSILEKAKKRFALNLDNITFAENIFTEKTSFLYRQRVANSFDRIIFYSDGSLPLLPPNKTILLFQFPIEWVNTSSLLTKVKLVASAKILCNSAFTKSFIDRKLGKPSMLVYPPVEMKESKHKKENIILTVGRFSLLPNGNDYKKHGFMIEAFKKIIDSGVKDWKFILVVSYFEKDNNHLEELKKRIKNYPISIETNVSEETINALYGSAKIYWHAAGYDEDVEKFPERTEHFGIATVEAMSAGCIPVVINAGGQPEIVSDGENGFLWKTEKELMMRTQEIIKDDVLANRLRSKLEDLEKKFGMQRFCKQVQEIIK
jgi:glycosyltransferase involved in cell wall biosynthesis